MCACCDRRHRSEQRTHTHFQCQDCGVALCIDGCQICKPRCWEFWHSAPVGECNTKPKKAKKSKSKKSDAAAACTEDVIDNGETAKDCDHGGDQTHTVY